MYMNSLHLCSILCIEWSFVIYYVYGTVLSCFGSSMSNSVLPTPRSVRTLQWWKDSCKRYAYHMIIVIFDLMYASRGEGID